METAQICGWSEREKEGGFEREGEREKKEVMNEKELIASDSLFHALLFKVEVKNHFLPGYHQDD
ncbi:hypothetical protein LOAG_12090 [Loa loa]|uniref:Uncharacterized protein n=1 Tax=Loa loa TaxID=7209 RepID=A0A1S0TLY5_LOALO|nr:hypothetical protein LOAG_12090 [Loa loa]EFO16416.1 hypothetical protein LOAG_12090 [Loa loa]